MTLGNSGLMINLGPPCREASAPAGLPGRARAGSPLALREEHLLQGQEAAPLAGGLGVVSKGESVSACVLLIPPERSWRVSIMSRPELSTIFSYNLIYSLDGLLCASH